MKYHLVSLSGFSSRACCSVQNYGGRERRDKGEGEEREEGREREREIRQLMTFARWILFMAPLPTL